MADRNLALALAKVIIAAAWADGKMSQDEINSLKDLLFRIPQGRSTQGLELTANEWARLEMYIQSPVGSTERSRLIEDLQDALRTPRDRTLAIEALEDLIQADGVVTDTERAVVNEMKAALNAVDLSIIGQLSRLIPGAINRRTQALSTAPNREEFFGDFVKNKVYYSVRQRLNMEEADLNISDAEMRKLSLAGGLMARVAGIDRKVTPQECDKIAQLLEASWHMSHSAATLVAEVAVSEFCADLDFYRLTREFATSTTPEERVHFIDALFAVAHADGQVSTAENDEIRQITQALNLTHEQFISAKVKIPREQRTT